MEINWLSILCIGSFAFVSVALGIKWLGEILIEYRLAKSGIMISKILQEELDDEE
jgi:hypothetical protein|tara:strand:- start:3580 stop:3744 length:165 start_codon:yes stop_codon:yes gene_type:complete